MQIKIASNRHQVWTPKCTGIHVPDHVHCRGRKPPDFTEEAACLKHLKTAGGFMEMKRGGDPRTSLRRCPHHPNLSAVEETCLADKAARQCMNTQTWNCDQIRASKDSLSSHQYPIAGPGLVRERSCRERTHRHNFHGMGGGKATTLLITDQGALVQHGVKSKDLLTHLLPDKSIPQPTC